VPRQVRGRRDEQLGGAALARAEIAVRSAGGERREQRLRADDGVDAAAREHELVDGQCRQVEQRGGRVVQAVDGAGHRGGVACELRGVAVEKRAQRKRRLRQRCAGARDDVAADGALQQGDERAGSAAVRRDRLGRGDGSAGLGGARGRGDKRAGETLCPRHLKQWHLQRYWAVSCEEIQALQRWCRLIAWRRSVAQLQWQAATSLLWHVTCLMRADSACPGPRTPYCNTMLAAPGAPACG
jgi:hypothetical protein